MQPTQQAAVPIIDFEQAAHAAQGAQAVQSKRSLSNRNAGKARTVHKHDALRKEMKSSKGIASQFLRSIPTPESKRRRLLSIYANSGYGDLFTLEVQFRTGQGKCILLPRPNPTRSLYTTYCTAMLCCLPCDSTSTRIYLNEIQGLRVARGLVHFPPDSEHPKSLGWKDY